MSYFYKGIVLKIGVKITLFYDSTILFLKNAPIPKGILLKNKGQNPPLRYFFLKKV